MDVLEEERETNRGIKKEPFCKAVIWREHGPCIAGSAVFLGSAIEVALILHEFPVGKPPSLPQLKLCNTLKVPPELSSHSVPQPDPPLSATPNRSPALSRCKFPKMGICFTHPAPADCGFGLVLTLG